MFLIGLTGGIGSGKSTVAEFLARNNIPIVDADLLSRRAVEKGSLCLEKIIDCFGYDILDDKGELDRQALAKKVFNDSSELQRLEDIIHPAIQELAKKELVKLENNGEEIAVYMAPLIFEKNLEVLFDKTILVTAKDDLRIKRILKRDNLSKLEAQKRIDSQLSDRKKTNLADYTITNNGSLDDLFYKLNGIWQKIFTRDLVLKN